MHLTEWLGVQKIIRLYKKVAVLTNVKMKLLVSTAFSDVNYKNRAISRF